MKLRRLIEFLRHRLKTVVYVCIVVLVLLVILDYILVDKFRYLKVSLALVLMIADTLGLKRAVISVPPALGYWACRLTGLLVRDVVITREEIRGLMDNRLCAEAPPLGATQLSEWVAEHRGTLGNRYTSELLRRVDRRSGYKSN